VPNIPDHVMVPPVQPDAVKIAFSVPQSDDLSDTIDGAVGVEPLPMVIELDAPEVPQVVAHVAV
jgi:hypothetical protein